MTNVPNKADPAMEWRQASVQYDFAPKPAVGPIDLQIRPGERVLLLGPSGAGKSTLLQTLTGFIPRRTPAQLTGTVSLFGEPAADREPYDWSQTVAQYFQDAGQTLCGMLVGDEIAFALENRAVPVAKIEAQIIKIMQRLELPSDWVSRRTMSLSGGEKQLVALAATLAQNAPIFVADEPTAHLSPVASKRLSNLIAGLDAKTSILIVDHRLDHLLELITRVVVLNTEGKICAEGPPADLFRTHHDLLKVQGIWQPRAAHIDKILTRAHFAPAMPPLTITDVLDHLKSLTPAQQSKARTCLKPLAPIGNQPVDTQPIAQLTNAECAPFLGPTILRDINLKIRAGEIIGILGANGAGKTTLAASLAGILRVKGGQRHGILGGIAFQNPENQFTSDSVENEIRTALNRQNDTSKTDDTLTRWGLISQRHQHPFELSQGQKRRLALACLTADQHWPLIILDEPLAGLDAKAAATLEATILEMQAEGRAIAIVTHDMDFALRICPRSIIVGESTIIADGPTAGLLNDKNLLTRADLAPSELEPLLKWMEAEPSC